MIKFTTPDGSYTMVDSSKQLHNISPSETVNGMVDMIMKLNDALNNDDSLNIIKEIVNLDDIGLLTPDRLKHIINRCKDVLLNDL